METILAGGRVKIKPRQTKIRTYNRKIQIIPKDTYIQFRITTALANNIKKILQERGTTLTDYFTNIIEMEIKKEMNKSQTSILEVLEQVEK
jgi:hypothetical protein